MPSKNDRLILGALEVEPLTYTATFKGEVLQLAPTEVEMLAELIRRHEVVCSRKDLAEAILRQEGTIDSLIGSLRQKVHPELIRTVRGRGWILNRHVLGMEPPDEDGQT